MSGRSVLFVFASCVQFGVVYLLIHPEHLKRSLFAFIKVQNLVCEPFETVNIANVNGKVLRLNYV